MSIEVRFEHLTKKSAQDIHNKTKAHFIRPSVYAIDLILSLLYGSCIGFPRD